MFSCTVYTMYCIAVHCTGCSIQFTGFCTEEEVYITIYCNVYSRTGEQYNILYSVQQNMCTLQYSVICTAEQVYSTIYCILYSRTDVQYNILSVFCTAEQVYSTTYNRIGVQYNILYSVQENRCTVQYLLRGQPHEYQIIRGVGHWGHILSSPIPYNIAIYFFYP